MAALTFVAANPLARRGHGPKVPYRRAATADEQVDVAEFARESQALRDQPDRGASSDRVAAAPSDEEAARFRDYVRGWASGWKFH